jgi:DNA adenine methylase
VGLSLLHAGMIERLILVEKDPRIVCLLNGLLHDPELADRYLAFSCTRGNVDRLLREEKSAFRYLVQLRCSNRGKFSGGLRTAIDARWCRDMVVGNIRRVYAMRERVTVVESDGLELMRLHAGDRNVGCFADPPYRADITSKGHMVYHEHKLNQQKLFSTLAGWSGPWLLTEDDSLMVRRLAICYRFASKRFLMTTADNTKKLVLWRKRRFQSLPLPGSVVGIQHKKGEALQ